MGDQTPPGTTTSADPLAAESDELKAALDEGRHDELPPNVPPGFLGEHGIDLRKIDPPRHGLNAGVSQEIDAPVILVAIFLAYFVFFPAAYVILWRTDKLDRNAKIWLSAIMAAGVIAAIAWFVGRAGV